MQAGRNITAMPIQEDGESMVLEGLSGGFGGKGLKGGSLKSLIDLRAKLGLPVSSDPVDD